MQSIVDATVLYNYDVTALAVACQREERIYIYRTTRSAYLQPNIHVVTLVMYQMPNSPSSSA